MATSMVSDLAGCVPDDDQSVSISFRGNLEGVREARQRVWLRKGQYCLRWPRGGHCGGRLTLQRVKFTRQSGHSVPGLTSVS